MKLTKGDYNCLVNLLAVSTPADAKDTALTLKKWFDAKAAEAYKEGWRDACEKYDVEDTVYTENNN